jgi:hypothetical protein
MNMAKTIKIFFTCAVILLFACKNDVREIKGIQFTKIYEFNATSYTDSAQIQMATCIEKDGNVHLIIPSKSLYLKINLEGIVEKKIFLSELQHGGLQLPNNIQIHNDEIVISDFTSQLVVFYDKSINVKNMFKLYRYPFKFRIVNNNIYYIADYMEKVSNDEIYYGYKIFRQNMLSNKEDEIYSGELFNPISLRNQLDLNSPKTIDFDINPSNEAIYCIENNYDKFIVNAVKKRHSKVIVNDKNWSPILYSSTEKEQMINYLKSTTLQSYPVENIKLDYKLSINNIALDPDGNIWLVSSSDKNEIPIKIYSSDQKSFCLFSIPEYSQAKLCVTEKYFLLYEMDPFVNKLKLALYEYTLN